MRIFKFLAIVAVAAVSAFGVKAQSMTNDFTRVYAGYDHQWYGVGTTALNGFILGGEYNLNVTNHQKPLFLGAGLEYKYGGVTEGDESYKQHTLSIPVNVSYKFGNENIAVSPYIGQSFRFGLSYKYNYGSLETNLYDDDSINRFQLILNLGVNVHIHQFTLGYRYQLSETKQDKKTDGFTPYNDYCSSITIGYCF